jgi:hypothetical protein
MCASHVIKLLGEKQRRNTDVHFVCDAEQPSKLVLLSSRDY